jgi:membrane-bound lytic murein transglycosylase F
MMMLTEATAEAVAVADRLDAAASIHGGARYLRQRIERIPPYVPGSDRLWMALAAYNVGQSHLRDARMLAVRLGENPNTWNGVKEVLPRLSERQYYRDLPAGYARGLEPVVYVERIRYYQEILESLLAENASSAIFGALNLR